MCLKQSAYVSQLAVKAMIYEVSATPKPGLVDRDNSGAHDDMDYELFLRSAMSFTDCIEEIVDTGYAFVGEDYQELFRKIRKVGVRAEEKMFRATSGVNTHKGIIFSLCLLSAAAGVLMRRSGSYHVSSEEACGLAAKMVEGITERELQQMDLNRELSHGERLYLEYGVTGIRGEAESGFESVLSHGLPTLFEHYESMPLNHLLIQILFSLMSQVEDTNILHRHDDKVLEEVQGHAMNFIADGGMTTNTGKSMVKLMDREYSKRRISPGGSADLLAVTVFLGLLEGLEI